MTELLSIIIVNYRTPDLTKECIRSVKQFTENIDYEIIVVDNHSGDGSISLIGSAFPELHIIEMPYNAGFARANNRGIEHSVGDTVLLLNSDTLVHDNSIGNCYREFMESEYGACGVQLLYVDGSPQITGSYFMKGSLNFLLLVPGIGNLVKKLGTAAGVKKPHVPDSSSEVEVDWINGAFLMVKKPVIEKVGMMDEDFFLYAEEVEWCYRIRKYFRLCVYGQYKIIHLQGATATGAFNSEGSGYTNIFDRKGYQFLLSNFLKIRKQEGKAWFIFHLVIFTMAIPWAYLSGNGKGYSKNIRGIWKHLRLIWNNRPHFYKVL